MDHIFQAIKLMVSVGVVRLVPCSSNSDHMSKTSGVAFLNAGHPKLRIVRGWKLSGLLEFPELIFTRRRFAVRGWCNRLFKRFLKGIV